MCIRNHRHTRALGLLLDTLTGVAVQYIRSIGKTPQLYANVAGRVEGNSLDIVQALEDLRSVLGFPGVSDTDHCLADSGVIKDIIRYTGEADEMPFVYSLPRFSINREKRLPSLPSTQHSFNGDRSEVLKSPKDVRKSTQGEEVMEGNRFLTAPLRFVEKEMSPVFPILELLNEVSISHVPDKHMSNNHHIPVLEAFAPSDDIKRRNKLVEYQNGEKKGGARPQQTLLRFKIGNLKRPLCLAIKQNVQEHGWFQEAEDKREKKSEIEENRQRIDLGIVDSDVK